MIEAPSVALFLRARTARYDASMARLAVRVSAFALAALLAGCGGGSGGGGDAGPGVDAGGLDAAAGDRDVGMVPFECSVLTDASQCWNDLVAQLEACVPAGSGVLDAARTECVYPDGTVVRFDGVVPTSGDYRPGFTVLDASGGVCGAFASSGFLIGEVTIGTRIASFEQEPGPRARLTCRDGVSDAIAFDATYDELSACSSGTARVVPPGYGAYVGADFVRIEITSNGDPAAHTVVDCMP